MAIEILEELTEAARQLYNGCVGESVTRMELVRSSEAFKAAKKIPKDKKEERNKAFREARKAYRYSVFDLQAYANKDQNRVWQRWSLV